MTHSSAGDGSQDARTYLAHILQEPAAVAAPALLGCTVTTPTGIRGRIVEVEAYGDYRGHTDHASHTARRRTPRNDAMFHAPGTLYIYRIYGIHLCVNIVCQPEGIASAVLIRAVEIETGQATAQQLRGRAVPTWRLGSGPGNCTRALGLTHRDNAHSAFHGEPLSLHYGFPPAHVSQGVRVGITRSHDLPWRWWDADSRAVSRTS